MKGIWIIGALANFAVAILVGTTDFEPSAFGQIMSYVGCGMWMITLATD